MKVLITGGCGFLGSNLAINFLKKDFEVIINDLRQKLKNNFPLKSSLTEFKYISFFNYCIECNNKNIV